MRILLLTPGLGLGGSERLTLTYARGLSERGHATMIAHGPPEPLGETIDKAGVARRLVHPQRLGVRTLPGWLPALRAVVRDFRPDVIHAQSLRTALAAAAVAPRTPLLVTVHGIEASQERGAALLLRLARARVTAVSQASADGIRQYPLAPAIAIVPPAVDVEELEAAARTAPASPILERRPLVTCVARHDPVKGVDTLIEAWPQVLAAIPGAGLQLVGGGRQQPALAARVAELGIAHAVDFTGFQKVPAPYLAATDLAVLPSRREGLPVAVLEAFTLERPVVATAVGGTPDVVRDDETGWLVPSERPVELAAAIVDALERPDERARRARLGHELVLAAYSVDAMLTRIEQLCRTARPARPGAAYRAARAYQRARIARARVCPQAWSGVRILGYHRIADAPEDTLAVSPASFRQQMRVIAESGAKPIRLDAALDLLQKPVDGRFVCVTFDDGYRDNLEVAAPVLAEHRIPATVYLPSRIIDGALPFHWYDESPPPPALSWEEVAQLLAGGLIDVQSHTLTHPLLPRVDAGRAREEIALSKAEIERRVPYSLTSFCYPAGLYGPREVALVREAGYAAAVTTNPGVNAGGAGDPMQLRRTLIYGADDLATFQAKLHGALDSETAVRRALHALRSRPA